MAQEKRREHQEPADETRGPNDELSRSLRDVLTLTSLVRVSLGRALQMPATDVEAMEHVMMAGRAGETLGPGELARRLGVTSAAATQTVNRLVGEGHLTRVRHTGDGRRQLLGVTGSGRRHVMGELLPLFALLAEASADLSPAERAGAQRYLDNVADAYRAFLARDSSTSAQ
ncbi:MarR family winged helix-turn-helix transcriptional regulator [Yinghuangia soli]|uniref:MarR family transcriptional regulator n=1 Tax=Yinghuangia soli TaxID=2908204 RepID=A0AA41Q566_9ACTN|nr:MarR family transcriptional regulator [Yinghuangia soli]MCF2531491.1 MarR family transcriptional regulator [Yinghuangia soli]